jgi:hypothetical protein
MAYAAGVVITRIRLQAVKEVFASLVEQTKKMGLEINDIKTKVMIVSQKPCIGNEYVKLDTKNTYIGTVLTYKNDVRPEIKKNTNANKT